LCLPFVLGKKSMSFMLQEKESLELQAITDRLARDAKARVVFLVDKNGILISASGDLQNLDTTSLASLAAGNVAATSGLAEIVKEKEFSNLVHEGEQNNIYLTIVNELTILVTIFDKRTSLGLVRLRVKRATDDVKKVFANMDASAPPPDDPFAGGDENIFGGDFTDGELDDVFGGGDFFDV